MGIPMLKIRRSHDRLIFNMGIPIPGKKVFILKRGPGDCFVHYTKSVGCMDPDFTDFDLCKKISLPGIQAVGYVKPSTITRAAKWPLGSRFFCDSESAFCPIHMAALSCYIRPCYNINTLEVEDFAQSSFVSSHQWSILLRKLTQL